MDICWDPPLVAAAWLCDQLGMALFHDGTGRYLTVVDDQICVAALPTRARIPDLERARVCAVVNMCREYPGPQAAYAAHGIASLRLPTLDTTAPSAADLRRGVDFIRQQLEAHPGGRVLIHCKGGRGRAATMALAWYASTGMGVADGMRMLRAKRKVVEPIVASYPSLLEVADQGQRSQTR